MEVGFIGMQGDANHVVLGLPFFNRVDSGARLQGHLQSVIIYGA